MRVSVADFVARKNHPVAPKVVLPLPEVLIGIEVEVDQDSSTRAVFPREYGPEWSRKTDGSLREGYEFVLASPLNGQHLVDAIYKLFTEPTKMYRTYTGSTHIHINMMDDVDVEALRVMALMAYAFEGLLYYVGDNTRQWCGYANRLISAPSEVLETIVAGNNGRSFRYATDSAGRYYGLNLQALQKFGTVEFRYFPTAESAEELLSWVKLVQTFKKAAIEIGTITNLINTLSTKEGYNRFVEEYFAEHLDSVQAVCDYRKIKSLMSKAMIIASTQRVPKSATYDKDLLLSRFGGLLNTELKVKKVPVPKYHIHTSGRVAPDARPLRERDVAEFGSDSITMLMHSNDQLYVAYVPSWNPVAIEWLNVSDVLSEDPAQLEVVRVVVADILETQELNPRQRSYLAVAQTHINIERRGGQGGAVYALLDQPDPLPTFEGEDNVVEVDAGYEEEYHESDEYPDQDPDYDEEDDE